MRSGFVFLGLKAVFSVVFDYLHEICLPLSNVSNLSFVADFLQFKKEYVRSKPGQRRFHLTSLIKSRTPSTCQRLQIEVCFWWVCKQTFDAVEQTNKQTNKHQHNVPARIIEETCLRCFARLSLHLSARNCCRQFVFFFKCTHSVASVCV